MILLARQTLSVAKLAIRDRLSHKKTCISTFILLPFLLISLPFVLIWFLDHLKGSLPNYPSFELPSCASLLNSNSCASLVIFTDNLNLKPFAQSVSGDLGRTEEWNGFMDSLDDTRVLTVFVSKTLNDARKQLLHNCIAFVSLNLNGQTIICNIEMKLENPQLYSRLSLELENLFRKHSWLLPDHIRLPTLMVRKEMSWFALELVKVVEVFWTIVCFFVTAFVFGVISIWHAYNFKNNDRLCDKASSAIFFGIFICNAALSVLPFASIMFFQSLLNSYWMNLLSPVSWTILWFITVVSSFCQFWVFMEVGGLIGGTLCIMYTLFAPMSSVLVFFVELLHRNDFILLSSILTTLSTSQNAYQSVWYRAFYVFANILKVVFWPLRLPIILALTSACKSVDFDKILKAKVEFSQSGAGTMLLPHISLSTLHSSLYYFFALYTPLMILPSGTEKMKAFPKIAQRFSFILDFADTEVFMYDRETLLWLSSVAACIGISIVFRSGFEFRRTLICEDSKKLESV